MVILSTCISKYKYYITFLNTDSVNYVRKDFLNLADNSGQLSLTLQLILVKDF